MLRGGDLRLTWELEYYTLFILVAMERSLSVCFRYFCRVVIAVMSGSTGLSGRGETRGKRKATNVELEGACVS